jgi:cleavage and polyadenylation specificity factor subunit 1
VVIFTSNSIIYVDQSSRKVFLPANSWPPRVSDLPVPTLSAEEQQRNLELEGCRSAFIDERTFIVIIRDGTVYPVEVTIDGKTVSRLSMMPALVQTTIPSLLKKINNDYVLIGSTVSSSVFLKAVRVEEEVSGEVMTNATPAADVDLDDSMELDDDHDGQL